MSKKQNNKPAENGPAYVEELKTKGVVVISGRSREELDEMVSAIPEDVKFYAGAVGHYYATGLYRLQLNLQ